MQRFVFTVSSRCNTNISAGGAKSKLAVAFGAFGVFGAFGAFGAALKRGFGSLRVHSAFGKHSEGIRVSEPRVKEESIQSA